MIGKLFLACVVVAVYGQPPRGPSGRGGGMSFGGGRGGGPVEMMKAPECNATEQQDCSAQFQTLADCSTSVFTQGAQRVKSRFEANKPTLIQCFTDNNCADPTTLGLTPPPSSANEQQKQQCMQAVVQAVVGQVQTCVQHAITDVTLPKLNLSSAMNQTHKFQPQMIGKILNASCANGGNKTAVRRCVAKILKNDTAGIAAEGKQLCDGEAQCLSALSNYCKCKFEQVAMQALKCDATVARDLRNITAGIPQCPQGQSEGGQSEKLEGKGEEQFQFKGHAPQMPNRQQGGFRGGPKQMCGNREEYTQHNYGVEEGEHGRQG